MHFRLRRADGCYRWFLMRGVHTSDATGQLFLRYGTTGRTRSLLAVGLVLLISSSVLAAYSGYLGKASPAPEKAAVLNPPTREI